MIGDPSPAPRLQVNHLATAQLAILLPLLLRTASKGATPRLVFVSSGSHHWSPPLKPPASDQGILGWLNGPSEPTQSRYPVSKLLNLFFVRELASHLPEDFPLVTDAVNPGFCISALRRNVPLFRCVVYWFMETFISWFKATDFCCLGKPAQTGRDERSLCIEFAGRRTQRLRDLR